VPFTRLSKYYNGHPSNVPPSPSLLVNLEKLNNKKKNLEFELNNMKMFVTISSPFKKQKLSLVVGHNCMMK